MGFDPTAPALSSSDPHAPVIVLCSFNSVLPWLLLPLLPSSLVSPPCLPGPREPPPSWSSHRRVAAGSLPRLRNLCSHHCVLASRPFLYPSPTCPLGASCGITTCVLPAWLRPTAWASCVISPAALRPHPALPLPGAPAAREAAASAAPRSPCTPTFSLAPGLFPTSSQMCCLLLSFKKKKKGKRKSPP